MDDTGGIAAQNVVQYDPLAACLQRKARLSESKYFLIADSYSKPFTGSPKVLLITTQGRPTHLTCGQNDSAYHNPPPKVMAKRATTPSFRSKCIARNQEQQPPSHKREAAFALVRHGAFSCVARSGGNVPAWLVFTFQATRRTFLFPRSSHSPGKRPESFMFQKNLVDCKIKLDT